MTIDSRIMQHTKDILNEFGNKYIENGQLKRNKVIEDLDNFDFKLMTKLFKDTLIHKSYVEKIVDTEIFKLNQFIEMFEYKEFWEDSYTKYANKIGLTADNKFIDESADVVLDFPFKDTYLKAGMSKEDLENDESADEPFLNETIAKAEIDELLEPKIFVNTKKYDQNGEHEVYDYSNQDNLVIKGNNLLALYSLKKRYAGKVKLIYIDPPYNTDNNDFPYNDSFNQSTWLTFMKNRLEIAETLLSDNGVIFIQTDDSEQAYLKVLCDAVFGEDSYLNTIIIKSKASSGASGGGEDKRLKKNIEFITVYAKKNVVLKPENKITPLDKYIDDRKKSGKTFAYTKVLTKQGTYKKIGEILDGSNHKIEIFNVENYEIKSINQLSKEENIPHSEVYLKYFDRIFTTENAQTSIRTRVRKAVGNDNYTIARYIPVSGKNKGKTIDVGFIGKTKRLVSFLKETSFIQDNIVYKTEKAGTLWDDISWSSIKNEGGVEFGSGEKPEKLLQRVISIATDKGDVVLDFFMGSATTQAVAIKMHRQFIGIEQMDYINTISVPRLQKVINGEQGGISKDVHWHGGGSFVYAELMEKNQGYLKDLLSAKDITELNTVYQRMKAGADFDFRVDLDKYENDEEGKNLSFEEQKRLLVKLLDKNQLYYNFNNIDDADVRDLISDNDYQFNRSFYGKED